MTVCRSGSTMCWIEYKKFLHVDIFYICTCQSRGELSYLAPLDSENISAPYFKQCFFQEGGIAPQTESNTTPPVPRQK